MYIQEAIKKAETNGGAISRKSWQAPKDKNYYRILATDTPDNCLTFAGDEMISKLWAPSRSDLLAADWQVAKIDLNNISYYGQHKKIVWLTDPRKM